MTKITKCLGFICMVFAITFNANAQMRSGQVVDRGTVSLEIQAQIEQAKSLNSGISQQAFPRATTATYVGSFNTNDGLNWTTNPAVYSGVEAAALLFGGSPSDYAISTNPNTSDPLTITHTAWVSTWGVSGCQEVAENYSLDVGAPGYNDPGGNDTATSAYVDDNCLGSTNYVWLVDNSPSSSFITTWKTTTSNQNITIPTTGGGYNYSVNWGDGNTTSGHTANATHTYSTPGTYTVSIDGDFPRIFFNNGGDRLKIRTIEQWGANVWTSMNGAFAGAENLVSNATDVPNLSMVTDMYGMFAYASSFNGDSQMNNWDVSNVTDMYGMFAGASVFDSPIGNWNVGNVTNMEKMFRGATVFNQPIGNWDVSNVTNMMDMFFSAREINQNLDSWNVGNVTTMNSMFAYTDKFDGYIGSWNVSNVTDMKAMFAFARKFNQDIGNWNVGQVTKMFGMFGGASNFNQPIGNWNVGLVTTMEDMFNGATSFNQNIGGWNVGQVTSMKNMFRTAMAFNQDLNGWNVGNVTIMNQMFAYAGEFNGAISNWNVSNVTDMYGMFGYARKFNQDIGSWNVGNVTDMYGMFAAASVFNQNIGNWNVGNVTNMDNMFNGATVFNQEIGGWDVSNVVSMNNMFRTALYFNGDISGWNVGKVKNLEGAFAYARRFDQDLGNWNVTKVVNMNLMFHGAKLSTANYDALLNGWNSQSLKNNVKFHGGNSKYCAGEVSRQNMITTYNWTIVDGGKECGNPLTGDRLNVEQGSALAGVTLYPNPMDGFFHLANPERLQLESVTIYDLTGRMINTINLKGMDSDTRIDVSGLAKATYMVVINGETGRTTKLMIKK